MQLCKWIPLPLPAATGGFDGAVRPPNLLDIGGVEGHVQWRSEPHYLQAEQSLEQNNSCGGSGRKGSWRGP